MHSMHSNTVAMDQCLDGMIDQIWKLRSRAIPYRGIQVKIGQGILSKCPNGQVSVQVKQLLLQISQNR